MGFISLAAIAKPLAAGAVVLACLCDAPPEDIDGELRKAAQHFADLEDDRAKAILDDLAGFGVTEAKVLLGYLYADPLYPGRDYEKAVTLFEEAAVAGSEEAVFQIAESRFWPDYSNWNLTSQEEAIGPSAEEVFHLLRQPSVERHNAAKWRLAWLCTFGSYACGDSVTDSAITQAGRIEADGLGGIARSFPILAVLRSGVIDSGDPAKLFDPNNRVFDPYLPRGYADADPFVADAVTALVWREVAEVDDCPRVGEFATRGRFLAARSDVARHYSGRLDLEDCFSEKQIQGLRLVVVMELRLMTGGFTEGTKSPPMRHCYRDPDAATFGGCLIHAVRDHYFACTKLSLIGYFSDRYKIDYADSERYARCRDAMIGAREG